VSETRSEYPLWELLNRPSTFGRADLRAVRARGTEVLFSDGCWRQCGTSGLWNVNLGYGNARIADAIRAALLDASYFTLFRAGHEPAVAASRALLEVSGAEHFGRVAHTTSGGSANDLVMKVARQYFALERQYRRRIIVGLKDSYHGLTYGSHGLSGSPLAQSYYSVDQRWIRHVSHEDPDELSELLEVEGDTVAAVVVEPVLGTGAHPLSAAMVTALLRQRARYGFLLVADEVATGFGRTGQFFASQAWPDPPDILIASKGMTNGTCAAAAVMVSHQVSEVFDRHNAALIHAETQAGTPPTCAAILETISEMERLAVLDRVTGTIRQLDQLLAGLADHPLVTGTGGVGCFRALRLGTPAGPLPENAVNGVVTMIREAGGLVSAGPGCIQLAPALTISRESLDRLGQSVRAGLDRSAERLVDLKGAR
jgi:adenosylmethionine-8-amino-7-oxononanoate aminotransferase